MTLTIKRGTTFRLGRIVATQGVCRAIWHQEDPRRTIIELLERHQQGDWGDVCDDDWRLNDRSVKDGRLMSVYHVEGIKLYIITTADRSSTTIRTEEEY